MFPLFGRALVLFLSLLVISVSSNNTGTLIKSVTSGDGITFPYIESKILIANIERTVLFVSHDECDECIKAAELRCGVLNKEQSQCVVYLLVRDELNMLSLVPIENSKVQGLMKPTDSAYKYVLNLNFSIESFLAAGEITKLREKLIEIENSIRSLDKKPKLIYLLSNEIGYTAQYVYLGMGRISRLGGKSSYYAYLYKDYPQNKVDSLSNSDLRSIEQARKEFIESRGKMSNDDIEKNKIEELATRFRTLDLFMKDVNGCNRCARLGSACNRCPNIVSTNVENVYYNLAKDNIRYAVSVENRISKYVSKTSVSSLFVVSDVTNDRLPNLKNSMKIGAYNKTEILNRIPSEFGPNCSDLSEEDMSLVEKIVSMFNTYFNMNLKEDHDEICIAVSKMSRQETSRNETDIYEAPYSIESCSVSLALSLGNFYPEFVSEVEMLSPETESNLIRLCSSVLGKDTLMLDAPLPIYSLKKEHLRSPTGGKLAAAILLMKSKSEETVLSSILGEERCTYEDIFNAGWKFDKRLRIWVRGMEDHVPVPIFVRYGITEDGKLAAFSLEGKDVQEYKKGVNVLLTDPEYCSTYSSVIGESSCAAQYNVDYLRVATTKFRENAMAELESARKNAELAEQKSKDASLLAMRAILSYEHAVNSEIKAMKLAEVATKMKEYHEKKRLDTERAIEIAKLEEDLIVATERRAIAAAAAADALKEATYAGIRRKEAFLKARAAAERASEKIKNALEVQKELKIRLKEEAKLRSSYNSAIAAEERLVTIHSEAKDSLKKIIREEKEAAEKYDKEMTSLLEEERRLKNCIEEYSTQRKNLLLRLGDFNTIINARFDESIEARSKLLEEAKVKREDLQSRKSELDKVLSLSAEKSSELLAVSSTISEYEGVLAGLKLSASIKGEEASSDENKYNELIIKLEGLKAVYEILTNKLVDLDSTQREMDELIKKKENELDILMMNIGAVEDKIARYEYIKTKIEEKSKEAAELFAKEAALSEKLSEIERQRKKKTKELDRLVARQASTKSDISSTLAARSAALGVIRSTIKELEESKRKIEAETVESRKKYVAYSQEAEASMKDLEEMEKLICEALSDEKAKSTDLIRKIKCARSLRNEELEAIDRFKLPKSSEETTTKT